MPKFPVVTGLLAPYRFQLDSAERTGVDACASGGRYRRLAMNRSQGCGVVMGFMGLIGLMGPITAAEQQCERQGSRPMPPGFHHDSGICRLFLR
jgi:hypothetical protein